MDAFSDNSLTCDQGLYDGELILGGPYGDAWGYCIWAEEAAPCDLSA